MLTVDADRCQGCGVCVDTCPTGAIYLVEGLATVDAPLCDACGVCVDVCPHEALRITQPSAVEVVPARAPVSFPDTRRPPLWTAVGPWIGAALAFATREVAPRVASELLAAWDRRVQQPAPTDLTLHAHPPVRDPGSSTPARQQRRRHRGGHSSRGGRS